MAVRLSITEWSERNLQLTSPKKGAMTCDLPCFFRRNRMISLSVIERAPAMDRIRLGLQGRDEEIEHICEMLTNMGAVGIGIWCYNFMAVFGWLRTSTTTPTRGGALVTSYDHTLMWEAPLTEFGTVSEERLWDNFAYFLEWVVPVAERARVKLALHPDDPPISPIRGIARIITSVDALKRAIALVPSACNGLTFCQGTITTMGGRHPCGHSFLWRAAADPFRAFP